MFHEIPEEVAERMHHLEELDSRQRKEGVARMERLRQIPPETGRFLALLACAAPAGRWIEIGASGGYSALWLALAARQAGAVLTTYELLPEKFALAQETFRRAGVFDVVRLVQADARDDLRDLEGIGFCFLDAEKEHYADCYEAVVPNLVPGGLLVADNAISHGQDLESMLQRALSDPRVDALVVPIGKGELVCRRI